MKHPRHHDKPSAIPAETEYLITDINEIVSQRYEQLLAHTPVEIVATNFRPNHNHPDMPLPEGITWLQAIHQTRTAHKPGEFVSMGVACTLEEDMSPQDLSVITQWGSGAETNIIYTSRGPLLICADPDGTTPVNEFMDTSAAELITRNIGLPTELFYANHRNIHHIIASLRDTDKLRLNRTKKDVIDPSTTIKLSYDALFGTDFDGEKDIVHDFTITTTHWETIDIGTGSFTSVPAYQNILRFARGANESGWQFAGNHQGPVEDGELLDDPLVMRQSSLVVPSVGLLGKTLEYLAPTQERP